MALPSCYIEKEGLALIKLTAFGRPGKVTAVKSPYLDASSDVPAPRR